MERCSDCVLGRLGKDSRGRVFAFNRGCITSQNEGFVGGQGQELQVNITTSPDPKWTLLETSSKDSCVNQSSFIQGEPTVEFFEPTQEV